MHTATPIKRCNSPVTHFTTRLLYLLTSMKDFTLQLNNPPSGVYFTGGTVSGTVTAVNDEPKDYKAIQVRIVGAANVHWSEERGTGDDRHTVHYSSHETYIDTFVNVWDRNAVAGGKFPPGTFHFPFTLQLGSGNLPPSFNGTVGHIKYMIEARVMKDGIFKRDTRCEAYINVASIVPINNPNLLQPKAGQVSKTLCCLCCASGPINITATVPRTGFCIQKDGIPVEVSVENGSSRDIRQIVACIHQVGHYTAQGHHRYSNVIVNRVASEPVRGHNSTVWRPPPIAVPNTTPTLLNCGIIQVNYILRVSASISGAINPGIDIPIVLGNVPLQGGTEAGGFPQPSAGPAGGYQPPPSTGLPQAPPPVAPTAPPTGGGFGVPSEFGFGGQQSNFDNFQPVGFSDPPPPQGIPLQPYPPPPSYNETSQMPPNFVDPIKKI